MPVRVLAHLVSTQKLPGTLLFSGPGGVGKFSTALSLAKILHCKNGGEPACDCPECKAIRTGCHPDVLVVSRDRKFSVEEMREIVALGQLKTSGSSERVIIFDRAELLQKEAANAALKMLEEPGARTRFILVTDIPASLLSTVRSRSYKIRFSLLPPDAMTEFASRLGADINNPDIIDGITFAAGRPGLFLRWLLSEEYRDVIREIREWLSGTIQRGAEPSVESMLKWKLQWRGREGKQKIIGFMNKVYDVERNIGIPRGADVDEIARWMKSSADFPVGPVNWQVDVKSKNTRRSWSDSRKSLLLARLMTRILSMDASGPKADAILSVQDFIKKINWNCSFDIALERLYFNLAGN